MREDTKLSSAPAGESRKGRRYGRPIWLSPTVATSVHFQILPQFGVAVLWWGGDTALPLFILNLAGSYEELWCILPSKL